MTKRFSLKEYTIGDYAILDNETEIAYASYKSAFTFCELLNELHKENEVCKEAYTEIKSDAIHLRKENKRLKCENKNLKAVLNDFINICNRLQSNPTDKQTISVARDMLQNMGVDLEYD